MLRPVALRHVGLPRCNAALHGRGGRSAGLPRSEAARGSSAFRGLLFGGRATSCRPAASRGFATAVFTVPAYGRAPEYTLFIVGLNQGKFFGQDGAEEGLKLLERVTEHHRDPILLFGLTDKELAEIETENKPKNQQLTPSRNLEGYRNCEMIPMAQASMVDRLTRVAVGRPLKTSQGHVAWQLWKHPREAINLYWAYWRRKEYKDARSRAFWKEVCPICSYFYFEERAEVMAIRAVEHMVSMRAKGRGGASILVVGNDVFDLAKERLSLILDEDAPKKFVSDEFSLHMTDRAKELLADVPDLTPVLVFVYLGVPVLVAQFLLLGAQTYLTRSGSIDRMLDVEQRD